VYLKVLNSKEKMLNYVKFFLTRIGKLVKIGKNLILSSAPYRQEGFCQKQAENEVFV
jgi:hypothetical protein